MAEIEAARLQAYLRAWTAAHPGWQARSAEDIAAELMRDIDFVAIQLAGWLQTPDGQLVSRVVVSALPYPENAAAKVMATAIQIAARQRTTRQRVGAVGVGMVAAVVLIYLLGRWMRLRGRADPAVRRRSGRGAGLARQPWDSQHQLGGGVTSADIGPVAHQVR